MPEIPKSNVSGIFQQLIDSGVDFIVVGGIAAVLEGVPVNTFDLDIVHSREPDNVVRLIAALKSLEATYRLRPELTANASHLASLGHQLLMTRLGPLDVLGAIGRARDYRDLLPHAKPVEISAGRHVQVLALETLITIKEEVGRERDLAVLPMMRKALKAKFPSGN